ncbi:MAG: hypothetical protein KDA67_08765 [Rhodobacteraceae bacterium]|nr:hypothetical protein [Paracoccaceae bacterium]
MPNRPSLIALGLLALVLIGCSARDLPEPEAENRNAAWPGFLPIGQILGGNVSDFKRGEAEISTMEGRIHALKRRAQMLKGPVGEVQQRLSIQPKGTERRT